MRDRTFDIVTGLMLLVGGQILLNATVPATVGLGATTFFGPAVALGISLAATASGGYGLSLVLLSVFGSDEEQFSGIK